MDFVQGQGRNVLRDVLGFVECGNLFSVMDTITRQDISALHRGRYTTCNVSIAN